MTEVDLFSKSNINILVDETPLGGVVDLSIRALSNQIELYELLSAEPWGLVETDKAYKITLKQYTDDFSFINVAGFTLKFVSNNKTLMFNNCNISSTSIESDIKNKLITTIVIVAQGVDCE